MIFARRSQAPSVLLGVACLLGVGCNTSEGSPSASCGPDLSEYRMATFQEPDDTPSPIVPLDSPTGGGWAIQVDFAPESHTRGAITYWVSGDEDVVADVQLARGTGVAGGP